MNEQNIEQPIFIERRETIRHSEDFSEVYRDLHKHLREQKKELFSLLERHISDEESQYQRIINEQKETSLKLEQLSLDTKDILDAWRATLGAIKVLNTLGHILKWVSSISVGLIGLFSFKELINKWL